MNKIDHVERGRVTAPDTIDLHPSYEYEVVKHLINECIKKKWKIRKYYEAVDDLQYEHRVIERKIENEKKEEVTDVVRDSLELERRQRFEAYEKQEQDYIDRANKLARGLYKTACLLYKLKDDLVFEGKMDSPEITMIEACVLFVKDDYDAVVELAEKGERITYDKQDDDAIPELEQNKVSSDTSSK